MQKTSRRAERTRFAARLRNGTARLAPAFAPVFVFAPAFAPISATVLALALTSCATPSPGTLTPIRFADIPGWTTDQPAQTVPALHAQCRRMATLPADAALGGTGLAAQYAGKAGFWAPACTAAKALLPADDAAARRYYEAWFTPYRIEAASLVTGYYEPEVPGSTVPGGAYTVPLLARPYDLAASIRSDPPGAPATGRRVGGTLVPYWTRAEIERGRIGQAARPLLWLADPVDLFFLQIQGAGRVRLPDGELVRVAYDGKNGRPYTPIGRVLVGQGALAPGTVTMPSIRAWLAAHPSEAQAVMDRNEDYVFFRVLNGSDPLMGPPGALGVRLPPGRAAAVDRGFVPLGTPVFIDTTDPVGAQPWRRLLLAEDTGSDITGPARLDIFLGAGARAALQAGAMHQAGTEYVLLPRAE